MPAGLGGAVRAVWHNRRHIRPQAVEGLGLVAARRAAARRRSRRPPIGHVPQSIGSVIVSQNDTMTPRRRGNVDSGDTVTCCHRSLSVEP
jgi:hypothetical protein